MAVPSYTTDLLTYNDCTSATGWQELTGMTASAPPAADTDLAIHGSTCITSDRAKAGLSSQAYVGAGFSLAAGECIFMWHKFFAPNSLGTIALGGARFMVGDSGTVYDGYYMDGSDTYPYGGWKNYVIDPTTTPDQTAGTTTATYAMVGGGWNCPTQAPSKGNPFNTDIIRYGRGESIFTGGELADYATFDGYAIVNDNPTTGRFGLLQAQGTGYLFKGLMSLGTVATAVDMRDTNVAITIDDTFKTTASFNRVEMVNATSNIEWTNVSFEALGTVSKGQLEMIDNCTHLDNGGTFTGMDTFIYQSGAIITGRTYRACGQVTQGGATFTDAVFESSSATYALNADNTSLITRGNFKDNSTAIYIPATEAGPITINGSLFSGNTVDIYWAALTGTLVVNATNGSNISTWAAGGTATVDIQNAVTLTVTVLDDATGLGIENAHVMMQNATTKATIMSGVTLSTGVYSASINYTADIDFVGWARQFDLVGTDYTTKDFSGTITTAGASVNVRLAPIT